MRHSKRICTMVGALLLISLASVTADVIYVATDGNDATGDGSNGAPFLTIQKGIAEATNGDTVRVKNGTYTGTGNVNLSFQGKAILVTSNDFVTTPENLIIDCGGSPNRAFVFDDGETNSSVLSNFTIRNGDVRTRVVNFQDDKNGGAIKMLASPKIVNCVFQDCQARVGGAVHIIVPSSNPNSPVFEDCKFYSNNATVTATDGGAMYCGTNAGVTID
ncbi:hypothetical protein GF420_03605 [candidate division GN15 bacterium]|nr:hypothetical protein [candidate division GN15 bacterium]